MTPVREENPEVFVSEAGDEEGAGRELAEHVALLGLDAPYVVTSRHGIPLARHIPAAVPSQIPPPGADQEWASGAGAAAKRAGSDGVVAVGGGRCIDVAKLTAARAGLTIVTAPTQLSHDGICSPVAVVPNGEGRSESVGAISPRAVFVSLPTLAGAPSSSLRAGIGDLLANPLALRDWALAARRGLEEIDQRAWDLAVESFELIEPYLDQDPAERSSDPVFLRVLSDALILSGMSMIAAGSSRPASGAEHEISHAIDELYAGAGAHGAQVAFGCIVSVALYGEDTDAFRKRLATLGLPQHPADLGLDAEEVVRVLLHAPDTRPGRFTIIEDTDLDEHRARRLVTQIWGD